MKRPKRTARAKFAFLWALMADQHLSPSAKCAAVALLLKFHNAKRDQCNPSFAAVGKIVGRKRRSTIDAIQELKDAGWLKVRSTKGGSKSNTNRFVFDFSQRARVSPTAPQDKKEPVQPTAPELVQPTAPVQQNAGGVQSTAHEPLRTTLSSRESVCGDAVAPAPDGAALEGEESAALAESFERLCLIWRKPDGIDPKKAPPAFQRVAGEYPAELVLESAENWVAAIKPRYLPKLEVWLDNGAWRNKPPDRSAESAGRRQKEDPVEAMMNAGGWERSE